MSPFLLPKNVAMSLAGQGPTFTTDTVHDISLILRRGCPSESAILVARRTLENFEDNLWPLNGERDLEEMETKWDRGPENSISSYKRRRTNDEQNADRLSNYPTAMRSSAVFSAGITTTMQNRLAFSYHGSDSFISASTHLQYAIQENRSKASTEIAKPTMKPKIARQDHDRFTKTFKQSTLIEGQGSILNFCASRTNGNRLPDRLNIPSEKHMHEQRNRKRKSDDFQMGKENLPASVTFTGTGISKPRAVIPQELADHKLRAAINSSRPRFDKTEHVETTKPYIFLSSTPLRGEDSQRIDSGSPPPLFNLKGNDIPSTLDDNGTRCKAVDTRPATTLHSTTMAQVRMTGSNITSKKTLGVRRSMAGWSARKNHGFSIPSRRSDMQP